MTNLELRNFIIKVRAHEQQGMSRKAMAKLWGLHYNTINYRIRKARKLGIMQPFSKARFFFTRSSTNPGRIYSALNKLDRDKRKWIQEQIPEGASLSDLLIALLTDAYYEANPDADKLPL